MRTIFAAALAGAVAAFEPHQKHFDFMQFITKHNKSYATIEEFAMRFDNWLVIDAFVEEVNAPGSEYTHTAGHNFLSDYTRGEYRAMLGSYSLVPDSDEPVVLQTAEDMPNAADVDWRGNCTTAVKDQGQCGSCWAFAATETMESSYCLTTGNGTLYTLAPQQMVDCSTANYGCNGGWQEKAWEYCETAGLEQEANYPYTAKDGNCKYNSSEGKVKVTSYTNVHTVTHATTAEMMTSAAVEPNSVSIAADSIVFQTYTTGVITSSRCGTALDHAVGLWGFN